MTSSVFAKNLRRARLARGWSQAWLAERAGVSVATVRRLETPPGPRLAAVSFAAIAKVAHPLALEPWQLLVEGFDPNHPPELVDDPGLHRMAADVQLALRNCSMPALRRVEALIRVHLGLHERGKQ